MLGEFGDTKIILVFFIAMTVISLIHFIFYFFFKVTDYNNITNTLESYPLFNFHLTTGGCGPGNDYIIFHEWKGLEISERYYDYRSHKYKTRKIIKGEKEITKIHNNFFCYQKKKSYKELLYNNQIIKKNEECPLGYKNCGIIDTLEQKLCMPQGEECPLYDLGLAEDNNVDPNFYIYIDSAKVYYNKNTYDDINKKIIGKIIFSEKEPCYKIEEKLWRSFIEEEVEKSHLECELEILGRKTDERYQKKGYISYFDFYNGNLDYESLGYFSWDQLKNEYLFLYKREFLGIDRACDEQSELFHGKYEKLKTAQEGEKILLIVEPVFVFFSFFFTIYAICKGHFVKASCMICIFSIGYPLLFGVCIICQVVFLAIIIHNELPPYECSDKITNEVLGKEYLNINKSIVFTAVNLGGDILVILIIIFPFLYPHIQNCLEIICNCIKYRNFQKKDDIIININNDNDKKIQSDRVNYLPGKTGTIYSAPPPAG